MKLTTGLSILTLVLVTTTIGAKSQKSHNIPCSQYATEQNCVTAKHCFWNGNSCSATQKQKHCSDFHDAPSCNSGTGHHAMSCYWNSGSCTDVKRCDEYNNKTQCQNSTSTNAECEWYHDKCINAHPNLAGGMQ